VDTEVLNLLGFFMVDVSDVLETMQATNDNV